MTDPDYDRPPVVETVLGVQFEPLGPMRNAHLGAFWKSLGDEWKRVSEAPALPAQMESFTNAPNWGMMSIQFQLTQDVTNRLQIRNEAGDRMIQIQNGRLHVNWLGHEGVEYPRYPKVREQFDSILDRFRAFARREELGELTPNQWEVIYINRIPKATVWHSPADWGFFRPLREHVALSLVHLESFLGEWHYEIPEQRGRLHANFRHVREPDASAKESVILTLTARGGVGGDQNLASLGEGLDLGHETIVISFKELMSDYANNWWGLKDVNR
ncbi:MAG: TIGR04255 family protein [Planctomycetia bacterium]|nr:TIGR04255 family protein [Planctomycetia bacterium]